MFRCSLMPSLAGRSVLPRSYGTWRGWVQTFALVAMMLALAVAMRVSATAANDRPVRIVVLGDSLTAGLGLRADETFPVKLEQALRAKGLAVDGPFPADTVFLRAKGGQFDAVLTMYHDQGQIAMKLMGFEKGVTLHGGLPVPVATSASGSAFDIAGRGIAQIEGLQEAFDLCVRMAARQA